MNLEWTKYLSKSDFWNDKHYFAPIYEDVNIQFIHQIVSKTAIHPVPMAAKHRGDVVVCKGKQYFVDANGIMRPFDMPVQGQSSEACLKYITERTHHVPVDVLTKHLLGEKLSDVCRLVN